MPIEQAAHRLAFSYQRVSSGAQLTGDGIDRQADAFEPFCHRHGLTPAPEALQDRGRSAYSGKHRRKGALGAFLASAKAGAIPPGSVLVVDDLSRFSREAPSDALRMLLNDLYGAGLALGVCRPIDAVIDERTFNEQVGAAMQLQIFVSLAHEESRGKGAHSRRNWSRRHAAAAAGVPDPSPRCRPYWLDWDAPAGGFRENALAETPRRAVALCLAGYGQNHAARLLTEEGFLTSDGKEVTANMVSVLLRDRRLIGERRIRSKARGEETVLPGYFPPVVSAADFERVQQLTAERDRAPGKHGKGDKVHNIFAGVLFCQCGRLLTLNRQHAGRYLYLRCRGRLDGRCPHRDEPLMPYDEDWLLRAFMKQRWARYFHRPAGGRQRQELQEAVLQLEGHKAERQREAQQSEDTLSRLLASGALEPADVALLGRLAREATSKAAAAQETLERAQRELQRLEAQPSGEDQQRAIQEKVEAFLKSDRHQLEERRRFNNWLGTLGLSLVLTSHTSQGRRFQRLYAGKPSEPLPNGDIELHDVEEWGGLIGAESPVPSFNLDRARRLAGLPPRIPEG